MKNCYQCKFIIQDDYKFCPNCGTSQLGTKCNQCGFNNAPGSKFCQDCGTSLTGKTRPNSNPEIKIDNLPIPGYGITVEFRFSSSQTFDFAIEEARKFKSFQQIGEDKKALYRVNVSENEIEMLSPLLENLKGWRNKNVYHNGDKVLWDSLFSYQWCYGRKHISYKPQLYCFGYDNDYEYNLWGCIHSHLPFREHSELFTFGKWLNNEGDWEFDKDRIIHTLEKNLFPYRFCPAMNFDLVKDVLLAFPEKVNPVKNKDWKFVKNYRTQDGLKISEKGSFGYIDEYYANGVAPISMKKFLIEIAKKMTAKIPNDIIDNNPF